jgi:hypothetical protein
MPPRFHPSLDEQSRFSSPLNSGELRIRDLLEKNLDETWEVFVQPHLLNQQPDFLLVSPTHGVTVIEVKDWQPDGHRCVQPGSLEVLTSTGEWVYTSQDPIQQVSQYKQGIANRFLVPPDASAEEQKSIFGGVKAVVVLPRWNSGQARVTLLKGTRLGEDSRRYVRVVGQEVFTDDRAFKGLILGNSSRGRPLDEPVFNRFMNRLVEPEAVSEQRRPLRLSDGANRIATNPNKSLVRRVRGPAGSGKTLALAARASLLASQGKSVLVLTFNITLAHYISSLIGRRTREIGADPRNIDCIHIHGFCSDVTQSFGTKSDVNANGVDAEIPDTGEASFDKIIQRAEAIYRTGKPGLPKYDAILVDEGQDFKLEWWNFIRNSLRKSTSSELLLASDVSQDLYGRRTWTDEAVMSNAGFSGQWAQLEGSYRLPVDYVPIAIDFAEKFVGSDFDLPTIPTDHDGKAAAPTIRHWINAVGSSDDKVALLVAEEIAKFGSIRNGPHEADVIVLTDTHSVGLTVMNQLSELGISTEHIFTERDGSERRRRKVRFWPGAPFLKGSTVYSFKGWEGRAVIYVLDDSRETSDISRLAYTALTRVKGDPENRSAFITVINRINDYASFKDSFEREVTSSEVPQLAGDVEFDF